MTTKTNASSCTHQKEAIHPRNLYLYDQPYVGGTKIGDLIDIDLGETGLLIIDELEIVDGKITKLELHKEPDENVTWS